MKTYYCKWPNGTISILTAQNINDAFIKLDAEGNPFDENVIIYKLSTNFHIGTELIKNNDEIKISEDLIDDGSLRSFEDLKPLKFNLETIYKELSKQNENISN